MPPQKKAKKAPEFNPTYAQKYGLRILSQYLPRKKVVLVECRVYVAFRHECKFSAKRKVTNNIQLFTSFQSDQLKAHMEGQHAEEWREYNQSSQEEKESFFECIFPFKSSFNSHFCGLQTHLQFYVNK